MTQLNCYKDLHLILWKTESPIASWEGKWQPPLDQRQIHNMRQLQQLIGLKDLCFLLKGWQNPSIMQNGLAQHPLRGQLKDWSLEDLREVAKQIEAS